MSHVINKRIAIVKSKKEKRNTMSVTDLPPEQEKELTTKFFLDKGIGSQ